MKETSIFITIPWFDPAYKAGGPIQSIINLINVFKDGVRYKIFCGNTDINSEPLENIVTDQWNNYNAYTQVWYASERSRGRNLVKQVKAIRPDILYIVGLFSWHFNIVPWLFCTSGKKIISVKGMLHPGALSQKELKKKLFFFSIKPLIRNSQFLFHVSDDLERKYVGDLFGKNIRVYVASNFPRMNQPTSFAMKKQDALSLVTVALISPMKNHSLVLSALLHCKEAITYDIYGPVKDIAYWQECLEIIAGMPSNVRVQYHGDIPPGKVPAILADSNVFIMPSKSENYGHAIIEALSAGLPVITSKHTPWNGLESANAGFNVDFDVRIVAKIISRFTLMDSSEFDECRLSAIKYAHLAVDIEKIKSDHKHMFANA